MARLRTQYSTVTSSAGSVVARTSAPASPHVGLRWYNTATGVTYQWTSDGTSSFWVDITSGGIGTSAARNVDFVGDTDPHLETATVSGGLVVGSVYYNREDNKYFTCTTATDNANVWVGKYAGAGGTETTYKSGTDFFKVHTFLGNDTFYMDSTTACDILIVAGGGGGGNGNNGAGGGGGAGGFKYYPAKSTAAGTFAVTIGTGGAGSTSGGARGTNGSNSSFSTLVSLGGGGGGSQNTDVQPGLATGAGAVGSGGGGGQRDNSTANHGFGTANQGNNGGSGHESGGMNAGGGGGAGAVGTSASSGQGGAGGAGIAEGATVYNWTAASGTVTFPAAFKVGSGGNITYAGGGGGSSAGTDGAAGAGGGGAGGDPGTNGTINTGGGGGGNGGDGGSGIVIVRYQLNA